MAKQVVKAKTHRKSKKPQKYDPSYILCHPSTWIAAVLALALLVVYGLSMYGFKHIDPKTSLEASKLAVFDHIAEAYIEDMDYKANNLPTIKQATGYGVSDEDGVFYITFDFVPYTVENNNRIPQGDLRHAIVYFQWDTERNTYGHAFSYHDDASYHPEGTYIKIEEKL